MSSHTLTLLHATLAGIELALQHMRIGEKRLVKCAARCAWGAEHHHPNAQSPPPHADVVLVLTLARIVTAKTIARMSAAERMRHVTFKQAVGIAHIDAQRYHKGLRCYQAAMDVLQLVLKQQQVDAISSRIDDDKMRAVWQWMQHVDVISSSIEVDYKPAATAKCRIAAGTQLVACAIMVASIQLHLGNFKEARAATDVALEVDPNNVRALCRAGQVAAREGRFSEARATLHKALKRKNPADVGACAEMSELRVGIGFEHAERRALRRKKDLSKTSIVTLPDAFAESAGTASNARGFAKARPAVMPMAGTAAAAGGIERSDIYRIAASGKQVKVAALLHLLEDCITAVLVAATAGLVLGIWQMAFYRQWPWWCYL
ncbi:hypothetical protein JKP88DRAFT_301215 [Tribonema minus]|uniref:Uncharacterized protein n=1 Tax=Tribonema minus TaxID=303371 RepID=A0A835Z9Y4_9STRA|nr:hypothetical protein JKP88DRAFT_301215 [Tribonema minus]